MTETKHTPGPWRTSGRIGEGLDTKWLIHRKTPEVDGGYFCEVVPLHRTADALATASANARLIAAAPELLAACEGMAKVARTILVNDDPDGAEGKAAQAMLDAIGKATGATP